MMLGLFFVVIALVFFALGYVLGCGASADMWPREPALDEERYCRISGYSQEEIIQHGCFHFGPCDMSIRKIRVGNWLRHPNKDEEWFCTHSGFSKSRILARKSMGQDPCTHDGPCPMDIRKMQHRRPRDFGV